MSGESTRRYTSSELRELAQHGGSRTDLARVEAMSDQDVERAVAGDPDWDGVPDNWHERAEAVMPRPKVPVSIRLDADLIEHFRSTGRGWQTRVNAILRAYTDAKKAPTG